MSDTTEIEPGQDDDTLVMAAEIVAAYASNNQMAQGDLPDLIRNVHGTLQDLAGGGGVTEAAPEAPPAPAVPIDASVGKDAITCLECGKGFKTLKRHLSTEHGLSPADYRARWQLSKDYPLVAPSYSKRRAATARKIGLGRKPKAK
ncbi:MAG: MucR family transcriptional regulator [Rhodobacteraceae bacterium]|nr:MucR family transcriptional regulator [Paracoccaceae bacterium]